MVRTYGPRDDARLPSSDDEHENRSAGDAAMETDLDNEGATPPEKRSDGADELHLDP